MRFSIISMLCLGPFASSPASADVFTDDLGRCMVQKATDGDKVQLARWMFAAMSKDPSLANMANVTQQERDKLNKGTADLFSRLLLVDCRTQTVAALKSDGPSALSESARLLGGAAARQLMSSRQGQEELGKLGDYIDKKAWDALGAEAGIPPESSSK